jgi:hypothetical protein
VDAPVTPRRVSVFSRRTSRRISAAEDGRPEGGVGGWVQWRSTRRRCQPNTVAGFKINSTYDRRRRPSASASTARIVRSASVNLGRVTWRCSTRTWWAQRQDLGVATIAGQRQQPDASDHETHEPRQRNHTTTTLRDTQRVLTSTDDFSGFAP